MLVLTRKENERIMIGDDVEVVVVSIQGQRVKLGIEAPRDRRIERLDIPRRFDRQPLAVGCLSR